MWETQERRNDAEDSTSDPVRVRPMAGPASRRPRSLSLPAVERQINYGSLPSLSSVQQNRTAWDRLGLYMKGLPPSKHLKQVQQNKRKNISHSRIDCDTLSFSEEGPHNSLEELSLAAGKTIFSLKSDQDSLISRYETQAKLNY